MPSQVSPPRDMGGIPPVTLVIRQTDAPHDTMIRTLCGSVWMLVASLSDGAAGHERQFRDSKTGRRILSSENGGCSRYQVNIYPMVD
jgi:hypothetical protein